MRDMKRPYEKHLSPFRFISMFKAKVDCTKFSRKVLMLTRKYFANMKRTKTLRNFQHLVFEHING